ncbi:MAG: response regulator [Planctomycetes bacterium]|nr:response regulator [Planctomycetota bacterium]
MKPLTLALSRRPLLLFLATLALVFIVEGLIMYGLSFLQPLLSPRTEGVLDSALLTAILFPVGYFLMFRPLKQYQESLTGKEAEQKFNLLALVKAITLSDDFESALRITTKTVSETIGWDYGEVWVPDRDNKTLRCLSSHCADDLKISKFRQVTESTDFRFNTGLPGRVWSSGRYEWIPDISAVSDTVFLRNKAAQEAGLKACFGIPIINGEKALAVLVFCASESLPEDKRLVEMVSSVALQLGSIFQRKQMAEKEQMIQKQLYQAQKMESIGGLAGGVAHDFNNILGAVKGFAELALMDIDKTNPLYEYLKHIVASTDRGANLTRQLLLFSRKSNVELQPLNLNEAVNNMLKMLARLIGENIRIETKLNPDVSIIKADAGNIEQVLMNLAVNAHDAMPQGGKITITTEDITIDEEYSKFHQESRPGNFICLSISDTGIGMDKNTVARIFEPFFTTKTAGKGTGLGLAVVYGIVKRHEGWINVYSEPGQGAIFRIYLPVSGEKVKPKTDTKTIVLENIRGNGERILVVEDNMAIQEMVARALTKIGYTVSRAATGSEAREIFGRTKGGFHLVLSDIILPDTNGIELTDELSRRRPGLSIILSSGYLDKSEYSDEVKKRNLPFIPKPYQLTTLFKTIKETIMLADTTR